MPLPDQVPFAAAEFAENPEPRCPCLLLLDTSGSMQGAPIAELNQGLLTFREELLADSMAVKRVEVGVVAFGPVRTLGEFVTADLFQAPLLDAASDTPMGAAVLAGIEMVRARKQAYRQNGVSYYRPWVFLITDGEPTDEWAEAARQVHEGEQGKAFMFFAVGVEGANLDKLAKMSVRQPLRLKGLRFGDLFSWLSNSLGAVSRSSPGDDIPLQNPTTPEGWAHAG
jgi:uncharacterized protein YegL